MLYTPIDIDANDIGVARSGRLGCEVKIYATGEQAEKVAKARADDGTGVWEPDPVTLRAGNVRLDQTNGDDLQAIVYGSLRGDGVGTPTVTLAVTFQDNTAGTMTFEFMPPAYVENTTDTFPHAFAVDGVPSSAGKKVKNITGLVSMANMERNSTVEIWRLPRVSADWVNLRRIEGATFDTGIFPGITIPDGADATADVVSGRANEPSCELNGFYSTGADGLSRFMGRKACFRVEYWAAGQILVERNVMLNAILSGKPESGAGNDKSMYRATGFVTRVAQFPAP
jgi:hypothetical protein